MSKKKLSQASVEAVNAAKQYLDADTAACITGEMQLEAVIDETPKYTIVKGVPIQQYGGSVAKANGILDETGTLLAAAIARPGNPAYRTGESNSLSRTLMWGDVAIFAFDNLNKKLGACIMPSIAWMVIQSKDSTKEKAPFIRTPWDVRTQTVSQTGGLKPPILDPKLKKLADIAINLAAIDCFKRINENQPSQVQEQYSGAITAASAMASYFNEKKPQQSQTRAATNVKTEELTSKAAELLS